MSDVRSRRLAEIPLALRVESAFRRFFPSDWEDRVLAWTERERRSRAAPADPVPPPPLSDPDP